MAHLRRTLLLSSWLLTGLLCVPGTSWAQGTRGTVTGTVKDAAGAKQTAVTVIITTPAGVDRRAVADVDGNYVFGGLMPGEYRLRIDDERYAPWSQEKIAVAAGERKTIDIVLQPRVRAGQPGALTGTVIAPTGQPIGGAVVVLTGPGGEKRATSAPTGAYTFPGLAPGSYRVRVDQTDALPYTSADLPLAAGESRLLDIRLQPLPPPPPPPPVATAAAGTPAAAATTPARPARGGATAPAEAPAPPPEAIKGMEPAPDRWHVGTPGYRRYNPPRGMPFVQGGGPLDPYNQNQFKGDFPLGNSHTFVNLNLQFNTTMNPQLSTSAIDPTGAEKSLFYNQNHVAGIEFFGGNTVFQPKVWAARVTTVANINALEAGTFSIGELNKAFAFEEMFGEKRLAVLGPEFDFMTVRGGMQNFNSDFRGFLYVDNELGVRLFGNARGNRMQYNGAFFSMRERKGVLHDVFKSICPQIDGLAREDLQCGQQVFIGNVYFAANGADSYIAMVNFHLNRDNRETAAGRLLGTQGTQQVSYIGFHGDGHWGGLAINHAFYQAFGTDDDNDLGAVLGRDSSLSVNAQMAAVEIAKDSDSRRYRGSFFFASGDKGTDSGKAGGFDAIQDNPNFAGGQFQFWTQQAIAVPGIGPVSNKFSLLPDLRNKQNERANFLNPGLLLFGGGVDLRMSPSLKVVTNASMLRFADVSILNEIRSLTLGDEPFTDTNIGLDVSVGMKWRPFVNENLFVVGGFALLKPMGGFANALDRTSPLFSGFATFQLAF